MGRSSKPSRGGSWQARPGRQGSRPPAKPLYDLPRAELLAELGRLNGTPAEVLANDEVMDLFLPMIRADFAITDCYHRGDAAALDVPLTLFTGHDDPEVPEDKLAAWEAFGPSGFARHDFPGDHFFLHTEEERLLAVLAETLLNRGGQGG